MNARSSTRPVAALALMLLVPGCSGESNVTEPTAQDRDGLEAMLFLAIQDEYHAEAVYAGVLGDFGVALPFRNILEAEVRHSEALAGLYANRGWEVPGSDWTTVNVPHFDSLAEACAVGVAAELDNIAVYDRLLAEPGLPADVVRVFTSNRAASLERHLPTFRRCAGL